MEFVKRQTADLDLPPEMIYEIQGYLEDPKKELHNELLNYFQRIREGMSVRFVTMRIRLGIEPLHTIHIPLSLIQQLPRIC